MNLYSLFPALNGKKSLISGYGLLILGIGGLLNAVGGCLVSLDLQQCFTEVTSAYEPLLAAFMGLGVIGISHKATKTDDKITEIKATTASTERTVDVIEATTDTIEKAV